VSARASKTVSYDLIAIGSGPAGRGAAMQAAALGKRAAIVEQGALGGVSINVGTLPSQTLRAAIVELTGQAHGIYRNAYRARREITLDDLLWRTPRVIERERDRIHDELRRSGVEVIAGAAAFADPSSVVVTRGDERVRIAAERFVIAVGSTPFRPPAVDFDGRTVLDADRMLGLAHVPQRLTVIGGGIVGAEYSSMAAALGVHVTLVDRRRRILDLVDPDIVEVMQYHLRGIGLDFRLGETMTAVERRSDGAVVTHLESGRQVESDVVLHAGGRRGATDGLDLAAAGLAADARGRIPVDAAYRTAQPHILAAGAVTGLCERDAASKEQGRIAALMAFGVPARPRSALVPVGIYTIPEISFVGASERGLAERNEPYVCGITRYGELARGEITGDHAGMLKLLVHARTRRLLGAHLFGTSAAELVHLAQAVIAGDLTVDYLVDAAVNVPAFAEAYTVAALAAADRLDTLGRPARAA
jgi:NAD(P) transhydrogenase